VCFVFSTNIIYSALTLLSISPRTSLHYLIQQPSCQWHLRFLSGCSNIQVEPSAHSMSRSLGRFFPSLSPAELNYIKPKPLHRASAVTSKLLALSPSSSSSLLSSYIPPSHSLPLSSPITQTPLTLMQVTQLSISPPCDRQLHS